ncbi:unnamed protein product [Calicophoron daubneyi]|uniref:Uncharacterized protein n=1 Tax=Calicophoron daubneyi TaxID=300641 RepID=A0AAV2TG12_CALDB
MYDPEYHYPNPPPDLTNKILQWMLAREEKRKPSTCFHLQSIQTEKEVDHVNVILRFNIVNSESLQDHERWSSCVKPMKEDETNEIREEEKYTPYTAIVVCFCVLAAFLLLVLFLRCRSCLRRRYYMHQLKSQKFWYCGESDKEAPPEEKQAEAQRWISVQTNVPASWSDGMTLYNHYRRCSTLNSEQNGWRSFVHQGKEKFFGDASPSQLNRLMSNSSGSTRFTDNDMCSSPVLLAAGYTEYYRRQGKLPTGTREAPTSCRTPNGRPPTLRQIYQRSINQSGNHHMTLLKQSQSSADGPANVIFQLDEDEIYHQHPSSSSRDKRSSSETTDRNLVDFNHCSQKSSVTTVDEFTGCLSDGNTTLMTVASVNDIPGDNKVTDFEKRQLRQYHSQDSDQSQNSQPESCENYPSPVTTGPPSPQLNEPTSNYAMIMNVPLITTTELSDDKSSTPVQASPGSNETTETGKTGAQIVPIPKIHPPRSTRPALCLFSARKRNRRLGLGHCPSDTFKRYAEHNEHERMKSDFLMTSPPSLVQSASSLKAVPLQTQRLNTPLSPSDARSWSNFKEMENLKNDYSYVSTGSTLSPPTNMDLPDVFLNPPSLSSLQSKRSSVATNCTLDYIDYQNRDNGMPVSQSFLCTPNTEMYSSDQAYDDEGDKSIYDQKYIPRLRLGSRDWRSNENLENPSNCLGNLAYQPYLSGNFSEHGSCTNLFPDLEPTSSALFIPGRVYEAPAQRNSHSSALGTIKRAISLNLRPKAPKSLGDELQSIMDRHYEMTGIRMLTSSTNQSRHNSFKIHRNAEPSMTPHKMNTHQQMRRSSWTSTKDQLSTKIQAGIKSANSTLHLNCFYPDRIQFRRSNRVPKSVLTSLSTVAIPCIATMKVRPPSELSAVSGRRSSDHKTKEAVSQRNRRTASVRVKNLNALVPGTPSAPQNTYQSIRSYKSSTTLTELCS